MDGGTTGDLTLDRAVGTTAAQRRRVDLPPVGDAAPEGLPASHDDFRLHVVRMPRSDRDHAMLANCLQLRSVFVAQMGWFDEVRDDTDRYDADPDTVHFAMTVGTDERLAAAMRLTRMDSVGTSLSWTMLTPTMAGEAARAVDDRGRSLLGEIDADAAAGRAWDLTRLVNPMDGSVGRHEVLAGLMQMLAAGMRETFTGGPEAAAEAAAGTRWVFATTAPMKSVLDSIGVPSTVLARGRISPADRSDTFFCVAVPLVAYDVIMTDPRYAFTRRHMLEGLHKAAVLADTHP